jgi:hypothetical protein
MRTFARHASHCKHCADPYYAWKTDGELCDRGHTYARDVAKYIYSKGGNPHSVVDKNRGMRNEIEIPVDCEVIRSLTKAFSKGLSLTARKPVVSHDRDYYVPSRTDSRREGRERGYYDESRGYGVEITPGGRRERERYPREPRRDHGDNNRGSLYHLDEAAFQTRRRYHDEPVMIIAGPNSRRRYDR